MDSVRSWLLERNEPGVRARALVDLVGRAPDDADVVAARADITKTGAAARLLDGVVLRGADADSLYKPKYGAPFHRLIALAEMGVTAREPRASALLDACLDAFYADWDDQEVCLTGNLARAALLMGRGDDPRVGRALAWLVDAQLPDGGWHCWPDRVPHGTLDAWEALAAFAVVPAGQRPPAMRAAIARGVEFALEQRLGVEDPYAPWRRLHWPRHYYYDFLVGLEIVTQLGVVHDARLAPALAALDAARGADGTWRAASAHPDLAEGADYSLRAPESIAPLIVEPPGAPSKWLTLAALRVRRRVGTREDAA